MFTAVGLILMAAHPFWHQNGNGIPINGVHTSRPDTTNTIDYQINHSEDSLKTELPNLAHPAIPQNEIFIIPAPLARLPIDFQINSSIRYGSFDHFVSNEAKKTFFHALLKDQELQQLATLTDSLRKTYSKATSEQKQAIATEILESEEKSIALNQEIPLMYQTARELEDQYWKTASPVAIMKFQEKISHYMDSIEQISGIKTELETPVSTEVPDTLTLFKSMPSIVENPAVAADAGIIYKIQIGAYKGKIPESANKQIKKISILRKVENHVDEKGVKVYTTGSLRLYPEAATMLGQVKQEGIKNAVIAAYQNGKTISVNEARKLNNEL